MPIMFTAYAPAFRTTCSCIPEYLPGTWYTTDFFFAKSCLPVGYNNNIL